MTGREAENYVAEYLSKLNYFVGDFNKGVSGQQPFDQIAISKDLILAYDVKHCKTNYFPFTRVEENQINALSYLTNMNNKMLKTGIILVYKKDFYYLDFKRFKELLDKGDKSIKPKEQTPLNNEILGKGGVK